MTRVVTVLVVSSLLLAGCTHPSAGPGTAATVETTTTHTLTRAPSQTGPVSIGPTTSKDTGCPFLDPVSAAADIGVRLGRISTLSSHGKPIGCRFYADQDPYFKASEHLPGPNQPVLQIVVARYADATAAHNAMVGLAEAGTNAYQADLNTHTEGISFQTRFDPADGNRDWAYSFRRGSTIVVISTAQVNTALNARTVAAAIASRF